MAPIRPPKHPEKVKKRRNLVISAMADMGKITKGEADKAKAAPLNLIPAKIDSSEAPYLWTIFVRGCFAIFPTTL